MCFLFSVLCTISEFLARATVGTSLYVSLRVCVSAFLFFKTHFRVLYMFIGVGQGTCKKSSPYPARAYTALVVLVFLFESH